MNLKCSITSILENFFPKCIDLKPKTVLNIPSAYKFLYIKNLQVNVCDIHGLTKLKWLHFNFYNLDTSCEVIDHCQITIGKFEGEKEISNAMHRVAMCRHLMANVKHILPDWELLKLNTPIMLCLSSLFAHGTWMPWFGNGSCEEQMVWIGRQQQETPLSH